MTKQAKSVFLSIWLLGVCVQAQESEFPKLTGPYLGQKPPGTIPELFAPGIISRPDRDDYGITFSQGGDLALFNNDVAGAGMHSIFFTSLENGIWTQPKPIPYSIEHSIGEPVFSPRADGILFGQLRMNASFGWEPYICRTRKTKDGWEPPEVIIPGLRASEANDGTLYYTLVMRDGKPMGKMDIAKSECVDGRYQELDILPVGINSEFNELHPVVSPDESFLVFDSDRPGGFGDFDLFVAFRDEGGKWGKAVNLGSLVNSDGYEGVPTLSLDGRFLFFTHKGDIYWVSARIIEKLRPKE